MPPDTLATNPSQPAPAHFTRFEQLLLASGAGIGFLAFWFTGELFRIPAEKQFSISILQQPSIAPTVLVILIVYLAMVLIGSLVCGRVGFDAGLFCASCGLTALSLRGGGLRYTLFAAIQTPVWPHLAGELLIFAAILTVGWFLQIALRRKGMLHDDFHFYPLSQLHDTLGQKLLALMTNLGVMIAILMLLCQNDPKPQALISVGVASFLGTMVAYYLVPTAPNIWYWIVPLLTGAIGYLLQAFSSDPVWHIGAVRGLLAGVARPMPIDYVGIGVACSIFAYWIARRWQYESETTQIDTHSSEI